MGTERLQPLTLICNYPEGTLYTLQADLTGLKILDVEVGLDWALLIAFNRGKLETVKGSRIYRQYAAMADGCDSASIKASMFGFPVGESNCRPIS